MIENSSQINLSTKGDLQQGSWCSSEDQGQETGSSENSGGETGDSVPPGFLFIFHLCLFMSGIMS